MTLHDYTSTPTLDNLFESPEQDHQRKLMYLNESWPMLCHEIGHAAAWFDYGEAIGPLTVPGPPTHDAQPEVCLAPRNGKVETQWSREYATSYAIRLLAGDIAGRMAIASSAGLSTEKITAQDVFVRDCNDAVIIPRRPNPSDDVGKVLLITERHEISDFENWVATRFTEARRKVGKLWPQIEAVARSIQQRLKGGVSLTLSGRELIRFMQEFGIGSTTNVPIELILEQQHWFRVLKLRLDRSCERRKDPSVPKLVFC